MTWVRAKERHVIESIKEIQRLGLDQMEIDESRIEMAAQDHARDYLATLLESISFLRNHSAHGSTSLHNQVLGTFQVVSEIINRLRPLPDGEGRPV